MRREEKRREEKKQEEKRKETKKKKGYVNKDDIKFATTFIFQLSP